MPLVKINMIKGKNVEYKRKVFDSVHKGLIMSLGIEDWDRFQRIIEIPKEDFETAPGKTEDFMIIELTLFPGRTNEQKKWLSKTSRENWLTILEFPLLMCLS